jgi:hypothetical protein
MGTFKIRHKSKENFLAFSETKNHKIDEPKVEMVQYTRTLTYPAPRGTRDQYTPHRVGGGPAEAYQTFWRQNLIN